MTEWWYPHPHDVCSWGMASGEVWRKGFGFLNCVFSKCGLLKPFFSESLPYLWGELTDLCCFHWRSWTVPASSLLWRSPSLSSRQSQGWGLQSLPQTLRYLSSGLWAHAPGRTAQGSLQTSEKIVSMTWLSKTYSMHSSHTPPNPASHLFGLWVLCYCVKLFEYINL